MVLLHLFWLFLFEAIQCEWDTLKGFAAKLEPELSQTFWDEKTNCKMIIRHGLQTKCRLVSNLSDHPNTYGSHSTATVFSNVFKLVEIMEKLKKMSTRFWSKSHILRDVTPLREQTMSAFHVRALVKTFREFQANTSLSVPRYLCPFCLRSSYCKSKKSTGSGQVQVRSGRGSESWWWMTGGGLCACACSRGILRALYWVTHSLLGGSRGWWWTGVKRLTACMHSRTQTHK